jgi:hypothetical protein
VLRSQCLPHDYLAIPEEWLQQDLVEGFRWMELSVFPHVERQGWSYP